MKNSSVNDALPVPGTKKQSSTEMQSQEILYEQNLLK